MKVPAFHSTVPSDLDVYHDNESCILAARIAVSHRAPGVDGRPWCTACASLDWRATTSSLTPTSPIRGQPRWPEHSHR